MYKVTLSDGTQIDKLELNGNNFISNRSLSETMFEGKLDTVLIFDGENTETLHDVVLISLRVVDGKTWFILAEKSEEQKEKERLEDTFTDIEMAIAEVYEMIIGG